MLTASCDSNPGDNVRKLPHLEFDCGLTLFKLESAMRYVVYVEMKFPLKQTGAISNLVYFTTLSISKLKHISYSQTYTCMFVYILLTGI